MRTLAIFLALAISALGQSVTISAPVFSGAGLNDATSGGAFSLLPTNATYVVTVSATGTPDHFTWTKNGGTASSAVAITGSFQALTDGVQVKFAATTGHTLANSWTINANAKGSLSGVNTLSAGAGARVRTAEDKARDVISVKDFGAKGDGVTDDTIAIQTAINSAPTAGAVVEVPSGSYLTGALTMRTGVEVHCASMSGTKFLAKDASEIMFTMSAVSQSGISNCSADANAKAHVQFLEMNTYPNVNHKFRDVYISGVETCLRSSDTYFDSFENVRCFQPTVYGFLFQVNSNSITCTNCSVLSTASGVVGLQVNNSGAFSFVGGTIEGTASTVVYQLDGASFTGTYWERVGGTNWAHVQVGTATGTFTSGIRFTGCIFSVGSSYTLDIYQVSGLEVTGSSLNPTTAAFRINNDANTGKRALNLGNNKYNINGSGYDWTKIFYYANAPDDTANSSISQEVVNPMLFSGAYALGAAVAPADDGIQRGQGVAYIDPDTGLLRYKYVDNNTLSDAVSSGTFTGSGSHFYTAQIDFAGTPDTFRWSKDGGTWTTGVAITGAAQTLTDGVKIKFAATTGHALDSAWKIRVAASTIGAAYVAPRLGIIGADRLYYAPDQPVSQYSINYILNGVDGPVINGYGGIRIKRKLGGLDCIAQFGGYNQTAPTYFESILLGPGNCLPLTGATISETNSTVGAALLHDFIAGDTQGTTPLVRFLDHALAVKASIKADGSAAFTSLTVGGSSITAPGSGYSGTKTRTTCTTITAGSPSGCSNVTETYVNGLLQ